MLLRLEMIGYKKIGSRSKKDDTFFSIKIDISFIHDSFILPHIGNSITISPVLFVSTFVHRFSPDF